MMDWALAWHWSVAIAVRVMLLLFGAGEALLWRPEVSTPANTSLKTHEGIRLLQLGISPYQGDSCHIPPLWLAVVAPWVQHRVLRVLPNMVCDVVAAAALLLAAAHLYGRPAGLAGTVRDEPWVSPGQLSLLYLLNPFAVLACVAGSSTSAENMGVMLAVAGGLMRDAPMAAAGVAVGSYMGLHPALLVIPLLLLMWRGPEDVLQHVPGPVAPVVMPSRKHSSKAGTPSGDTPDRGSRHSAAGQLENSRNPAAKPEAGQQSSAALCLLFVVLLLCCVSAIVLLSDSMLQQHPEAQCLPAALQWVLRQLGIRRSQQQQQLQIGSCWAVRVYMLLLLLGDYTPNIGLWWYFFTEMFASFRPFFLFVFHSFAVIFAVPVAIRFSNRPLFVAWVQLFISCMFKPYESVADMVPWMALLPLLQQQLQCVKAGLFFVNSFVLLMVLGPAMWHQWINVDAANSNFFYSITLLLGVWYTILLTHLLRLTALLDHRLAGKRLELDVDDLDDDVDSCSQEAAVDGSTAAEAVDGKSKDA